jgi:hypothetical protein
MASGGEWRAGCPRMRFALLIFTIGLFTVS